MKINKTHKRIKKAEINYFASLIGLVLYRIMLEVVYKYLVAPNWQYIGLSYEYDIKSYMISWVAFIIIIPFIIKCFKSNDSSSAIMVVLYLMAFTPGTILMGFKPMGKKFLLLYIGYWIMLSIAHRIIPYFTFKNIGKTESKIITNSTIVAFSIIVIYISYKYTNFRLNFSIFNVYELRDEAKQYNMPTILQYMFAASRAVLPTLILYNLVAKKKKTAIWLGFLQLLIFSIDGSKSVLFYLILSFIGYIVYKENRTRWFSWGLLLVNIIALFENIIMKTTYIMSIFIRRMLFLPQLLNYFYYDFFSKNEYDYFRQSIMGKLGFESPYQIRIPYIIGEQYYGSGANNGLFSDAYYNLGVIGIFVMPIIIILVIRLLDACIKNLNIRIRIASIITSSLNIMSSSIFTVILSHGFLAVCVILYCLPRDKNTLDVS